MNDDTLNLAFLLAMEWGDSWLKPIQSRLKGLRPELTPAQCHECNAIAQAAMKLGHELIVECVTPELEYDFDRWSTALLSEFPWVSKENLTKCFSQGVYYSRK